MKSRSYSSVELTRKRPYFKAILITSTNEVLLDGLLLTNKGDNRIALKPSADSIQEFRFSKLIDDITGISVNVSYQAPNFQDYYNRHADKALSNFDVRHRFVESLSWQLPFGKGRRFVSEGWLSKVAGGFTLNTIVQAQSGFPLSISALNPSLQGLAFIGLRPNITGDVERTGNSKAGLTARYFNTGAFSQPAAYTFGNAPRTLANVRAPIYFATNLSVARDFRFTENMRLQVRVEGFNVFNRANFSIPGTTLGAANFGVITSTEDPRQFQLAARIYF